MYGDGELPCPRAGELVLVQCWCGGGTVWLPVEQVGTTTLACHRVGCGPDGPVSDFPARPARYGKGGRRKVVT